MLVYRDLGGIRAEPLVEPVWPEPRLAEGDSGKRPTRPDVTCVRGLCRGRLSVDADERLKIGVRPHGEGRKFPSQRRADEAGAEVESVAERSLLRGRDLWAEDIGRRSAGSGRSWRRRRRWRRWRNGLRAANDLTVPTDPVPHVSDRGVATRPALERVRANPAHQEVIARPTGEDVVAGSAEEPVVAPLAGDPVGASTSAQRVVARRPVDRRRPDGVGSERKDNDRDRNSESAACHAIANLLPSVELVDNDR